MDDQSNSNLHMNSAADGDDILDIQGQLGGRSRNVFQQLLDSDSQTSLRSKISFVFFFFLTVIVSYVFCLSALLFSNNSEDSSIYSLTIISFFLICLLCLAVGVGEKVRSKWFGGNNDRDEYDSNDWRRPEPASWVVISSGLLLGTSTTGLVWASQYVPDSTNYMAAISMFTVLFMFRRIFSRHLVKTGFAVDLASICLLIFAFFLEGEVGIFDLHVSNNITSDAVPTPNDMDYMWTVISVISYSMLGMVIILWEAPIIKQVNVIPIVVYSSLISVLPFALSIAIRYSLWSAEDMDGSVDITSTWYCISKNTAKSSCQGVAVTSGWIFIFSIPCMLWICILHLKQYKDSLSYLLATSLGCLLNGFTFYSFLRKDGTLNNDFTVGSVFSLLAVILAFIAILLRSCRSKENN